MDIINPFVITGVSGSSSVPSYSAGTWTPVLTFATPGNLSATYTTQFGRWIRVGNLFVARCNILTATFTHTSASGGLTVTGLPVAPAANTGDVVAGSSVIFEGITKVGYTQITPYVIPSSTSIGFFAGGSAVSNSSVVAGDVPTGTTKSLAFQIIYEV